MNTLDALRASSEVDAAISGGSAMPYITRAWYNKVFLSVNEGKLVHDQFGMPNTQPKHSGEQHLWRRWLNLATNTVPLTEGVTPTGKSLTYENVLCTLRWYGDWIGITDVVSFMHPDPVLNIATQKLARQAKESKDEVTRDIINAGTSFIRITADGDTPTNSTSGARTTVNGCITADACDLAITTLEAADADYIKPQMNASAKVDTHPIGPSFVAIVHPHMAHDFTQSASGFGSNYCPRENYAAGTVAYPTEVGKYRNIRFIQTTKAKTWADSGGGDNVGTSSSSTYRSTTGTSGDVYSFLILAKEAFGTVKLKGASGTYYYPAGGNTDPLAQRSTAGWKACFTAAILNDDNMCRIEALARW